MGSIETIISVLSAVIALLLLLFAVDWKYFRDWVVIFLFKGQLDFLWGSPVIELKLLEYPARWFSTYYDTSLLFDVWVFPILCILYNQITRERGIAAIILWAVAFSAAIAIPEYFVEKYTNLIHYIDWSAFTSFYTLTITFLASRMFIAFFRWGCDYFPSKFR